MKVVGQSENRKNYHKINAGKNATQLQRGQAEKGNHIGQAVARLRDNLRYNDTSQIETVSYIGRAKQQKYPLRTYTYHNHPVLLYP